jgi:hypothetical protein
LYHLYFSNAQAFHDRFITDSKAEIIGGNPERGRGPFSFPFGCGLVLASLLPGIKTGSQRRSSACIADLELVLQSNAMQV